MRRSRVPSLLMVGLLAFSCANPVSPATTTTTSARVLPSGRARFTCFIIVSLLPCLPLLDVGLPGTVDAAFDRLVGRALLGIARQHPIHLLPASCGNLEAV